MLPWALLVALLALTLGTYSTLPEQIPTHLDMGGAVTRSVPRSLGRWLLLPLVALATHGLLAGVRAVLPRRPDLFNFPEKERLLRLPKRFQEAAVAEMQRVLDLTSSFTLLVLGYVQWILWNSAHGARGGSAVIPLLVAVVLFVPLVLLLTLRVNSATLDGERRWREAGSPAA